jgi:hypothetical protein
MNRGTQYDAPVQGDIAELALQPDSNINSGQAINNSSMIHGRAFNMNNVVVQCNMFDIELHLEETDNLKQQLA